jgi:hypothetical protein
MSRKKNRRTQDTQVATEQHLPTEATETPETQGTDLPNEIPVAEVADIPMAEPAEAQPADAPLPEAIPVEVQVEASAPESSEPAAPEATDASEASQDSADAPATEATETPAPQAEQPSDAPVEEQDAEEAEKPATGRSAKRTATPKKLSALDAAYKVLSKKREPMSCQELIAAMAAKGLWSSPNGKTPHATLYAAILREISTKGADSRFVKADRGKFAAKID